MKRLILIALCAFTSPYTYSMKHVRGAANRCIKNRIVDALQQHPSMFTLMKRTFEGHCYVSSLVPQKDRMFFTDFEEYMTRFADALEVLQEIASDPKTDKDIARQAKEREVYLRLVVIPLQKEKRDKAFQAFAGALFSQFKSRSKLTILEEIAQAIDLKSDEFNALELQYEQILRDEFASEHRKAEAQDKLNHLTGKVIPAHDVLESLLYFWVKTRREVAPRKRQFDTAGVFPRVG